MECKQCKNAIWNTLGNVRQIAYKRGLCTDCHKAIYNAWIARSPETIPASYSGRVYQFKKREDIPHANIFTNVK